MSDGGFFLAGSFSCQGFISVTLPFQCAVSSCGGPGVDVKLVLVLKRLKLVCVAGDEDVHVQLPLEQRQAGHVAPGDHLVAVDETDLELAHCDHFLLWVIQVLSGNVGQAQSGLSTFCL